jgi:translation elongation factor EF-G
MDAVLSIAIQPKNEADEARLALGLQTLTAEDPTLHVQFDRQTRQTMVRGLGELHLQVVVDRLRQEFNVEATAGKPQVVYREAPIDQPSDRRRSGPPALLEPVMHLEIAAPRDCVDGVLFTLMGRRAHIQSEDDLGSTHVIHAHVPMAEMIGYATELRLRTQGRATYSMHLHRYQPLPDDAE